MAVICFSEARAHGLQEVLPASLRDF